MPTKPASFRPSHLRCTPERNKQADLRRGTAQQRGYDSKWSREAKSYRDDHPLCVGCMAVGRIEPSTLTDHIIPHKGDEKLFWGRSNWQALCKWHHDVVKQRLESQWLAGRLRPEALRIDSREAVAMTRLLRGG